MMINKKIDRDKLIEAILDQNKNQIKAIITKDDVKMHQFYCSDNNVIDIGDNDRGINPEGVFYDSKGEVVPYAFIESINKNLNPYRTYPDLVMIQLKKDSELKQFIEELRNK